VALPRPADLGPDPEPIHAPPTLREAAGEFLAQRRFAVAGVSHDRRQPANLIFRRLRDAGRDVFAVSPGAWVVEGEPAYASVASIPGGVDGVVVATPPEEAAGVVADCAIAGVPRVWLHRGLGPGSVSEDAIAIAQEHGIALIAAKLPRRVEAAAVTLPAPR
jgi:predicted CoA-binding protein